MSYTHTTLGQAIAQLALRLGDSNLVFWSSAELGLYLKEGLRVWNLAAQFFRDRGSFSLVANQIFYDLSPLVLNGSSESLLAHTITDRDLVAEIQYHLLEPSTGSSWTGTEQFSLEDITKAIERRLNQFSLETGLVINRSVIALGSPPVDRVSILDSIIDLRRVSIISPEGVYKQLWQDDGFSSQSFGRFDSPNPLVYSVVLSPVCSLSLYPRATDSASLELLTIDTISPLAPGSSATILPIPDDYVWPIKYGALADLLTKDGQATDQARSAYCEQRWAEGVEMAKVGSSVLYAEINGLPQAIASLAEGDGFRAGWQNETASVPGNLLMAGIGLGAFAPKPSAAYSCTMDVVRNAPIPASDSDPIQLGREHLDALLDYAQHVAQFKQGAFELGLTKTHYNTLIRLAADHNSRLKAKGKNFEALQSFSHKEQTQRPLRAKTNAAA